MMTAKNIFPVFLNLNQLSILLIGAGKDVLDQLNQILFNAPEARIRVVGESISDALKEVILNNGNVELFEEPFTEGHLTGIRVIISYEKDPLLSGKIIELAQAKGILVASEDESVNPDFLVGAIAHEGRIMLSISDKEISPGTLLRLQELLGKEKADDSDEVLDKLYERENESAENTAIDTQKLTQSIVDEGHFITKEEKILRRVKRASIYSLLVIMLMILGHLLFSLLPYSDPSELVGDLMMNLDENFWKFALFGFIAQMIDGALGMAYGVSVTTFLLSAGIPGITPAVASASMHASEIFTTGSSSLVYMRFRNINMKLFKSLLWPGLIGTAVGVITISFVSKEYFSIIKPIVAIYTLSLGVIIVLRAFKKPKKRKRIKNLYPIAFSGGFLDSVGGGGWGPIVTSSLLAGGRHLRYAVGSAHLAKFFVALVSTFTFFIMIGLSHWQIIVGLVIGGMIAAPISIYLSNKIPIKKGLILVGLLIIGISIRTLIKALM